MELFVKTLSFEVINFLDYIIYYLQDIYQFLINFFLLIIMFTAYSSRYEFKIKEK